MVGSTQLRKMWHWLFGHGSGPYTLAGWTEDPYTEYLLCTACHLRGLKSMQKIVYTRRPCLCQ